VLVAPSTTAPSAGSSPIPCALDGGTNRCRANGTDPKSRGQPAAKSTWSLFANGTGSLGRAPCAIIRSVARAAARVRSASRITYAVSRGLSREIRVRNAWLTSVTLTPEKGAAGQPPNRFVAGLSDRLEQGAGRVRGDVRRDPPPGLGDVLGVNVETRRAAA